MRRLLLGLVDDAGLFPPTELPMPEALARNASDRQAAQPMLTNRFLVPSTRLDELLNQLPGGQSIDLGLIHAGDGPSLVSALDQAGDRVRHVELKGTDALDAVPATLPVFVEPASVPAVGEAIAAVRDISGSRTVATGVKIRCGGVVAEAFPTIEQLASALRAVVAAGVPMKATAGLHSAVRNNNPITGFEHHGFVNLLLALDAALTGGDIESLLGERDGATLAAAASGLGEQRERSVRDVLVSYGSCSTRSPVEQAYNLGLLD